MATIVDKDAAGTVELLSRHLGSGALAIIPCDTVYGLVGVVPSAESALRTVKGRSETKPFIQLVTLDMAKQIAAKPIPSEILALWPGPLTVVVETISETTVAIRVPADIFLQEVLVQVGSPIYSTSVNISGEDILTRFDDMVERFGDTIPLYVKGDAFQGTVPSTIIAVVNGSYKLIRKGVVDVSYLLGTG